MNCAGGSFTDPAGLLRHVLRLKYAAGAGRNAIRCRNGRLGSEGAVGEFHALVYLSHRGCVHPEAILARRGTRGPAAITGGTPRRRRRARCLGASVASK